MKVHFITIVLDGMPFITWHYPMLRSLDLDWRWWVVEGVALPKRCTKWVAELPPRLSNDGTSQYLKSLSDFDSRVTYIASPRWDGKAAMFNDALRRIEDDEYALWQIDADEIWTKEQIELGVGVMANRTYNCALFFCRYFVGPDLVITSRDGFGNHTDYEWKRLWRVGRGGQFKTHEPPELDGFCENPIYHRMTEALGLVFEHYAYATEEQMRFKQEYYAGARNPAAHLYKDAVDGWNKLQKSTVPIPQLNKYLPWVGSDVAVDRIKVVHQRKW